MLPLIIIVSLWILLGIWNEDVHKIEGMNLPEGFSIEEATLPGLVKYPMFAVFDDQGKLFVFESSGATESTEAILENPDFKILLLEDTDQDGIFDSRTVFADQLPFPMGGVYLDGSLIVTAVPDLLKFTDTSGDGKADEREVLLSGWKLNHNAAILSGPFLGPDGWLYLADARRGFDIKSREFVNFSGKGARIWRCLPDGSQLQSFSGGGFDNAVELAFSPSGEVFGTMTYFIDPQGGYRDALMHWTYGGVYPKYHSVIKEDQLVRTGTLMPPMHKMARVSPSGLMRYNGSYWGAGFEGDLFHAEFNTGRIMQTKISPSGATFEAKSQYFLNAALPDFHPTDVLQEADGNLLMVNTGGWFIAGCPLSQTAKPEVPGGIFRIRKSIPTVSDPWGNNIQWEALGQGELVELLSNERPNVATKAGEYLLKNPTMATPHLVELLQNHPDEKVRTKAVFLLFRTQFPMAWNQMEIGLEDESEMVKTATARVLGDAMVDQSVDGLIKALSDPSLAVSAHAATALGKLGQPKATEPLLAALKENPQDRFFEHAVIFALIHIKNESVLQSKLSDEQLKSAVLIALDQKGLDIMEKDWVRPFLFDSDPTVRETGFWVLNNHPDWHDLFLEKFLGFLNSDESDDNEKIKAAYPNFKNEVAVKQGMANALDHPGLAIEKKKILLDLMAENPVDQFPEAWTSSLLNLLNDRQNGLQTEVLELIAQLNLKGFSQALKPFLDPQNTSTMLRLKAIQASLIEEKELPNPSFLWLVKLLTGSENQTAQLQAIRTLSGSELTEEQIELLILEVIPQTSERNVPYFLEFLVDHEEEEMARLLESQLLKMEGLWDQLSLGQVEALFSPYPGVGDVLLDSIRNKHEDRIIYLENLESQMAQGDVERGRALFFGIAACGTCHAVAENGNDFGPDLTNIGEIRSQHDILEAIVFPGVSFAREYETQKITTKSEEYIGIIRGFRDGVYEIKLGPGATVNVPENEVVSMVPVEQSLMPSGLESNLSGQELSDLMLYLISLPDGLYQ
ncbi:MAG: PVC-type heme-binding CxxCH protein [Cyclobacteriaceae bacterium]